MPIRAIYPRMSCCTIPAVGKGESRAPTLPLFLTIPGQEKSVTFFLLQVLLPGFMPEEVMHPYLVGDDDGHEG